MAFAEDAQADVEHVEGLDKRESNKKQIEHKSVYFGEIAVKERIKMVLSYKKPAFWVIITALVATLIISVCFLTNPKREVSNLLAPDTAWECSEYDVFINFYVYIFNIFS